MIYHEIRMAENQKVGFLDQAVESPDFYKLLGSKVDNYITYLKVLHNKIRPTGSKEPDEQVYQPDKDIINLTMKLVRHLEQVEETRLNKSISGTPKSNLNITKEDFS